MQTTERQKTSATHPYPCTLTLLPSQMTVKGGFSENAPSNARNLQMVHEMKDFKEFIKQWIQDLTLAGKSLSVSLTSSATLLEKKLPKAYLNSTAGGVAMDEKGAAAHIANAVSSAEPIVGEAVNKTEIKNSADVLNSRLQTEVVAPIEKWLEALSACEDKSHKLEDLRLNYDSSIKAYNTLAAANDPKKAQQVEAAKEKEDMYKSQYYLMEEEVNRECLDLLTRIQSLREVIMLGVQILHETTTVSLSAFDAHAPPIVIEVPTAPTAAPSGPAHPPQAYPAPGISPPAYPGAPPPSYPGISFLFR